MRIFDKVNRNNSVFEPAKLIIVRQDIKSVLKKSAYTFRQNLHCHNFPNMCTKKNTAVPAFAFPFHAGAHVFLLLGAKSKHCAFLRAI